MVNTSNPLRALLCEYRIYNKMLIPVNEHFEHGGYRYWRYSDSKGNLAYRKRDLQTGKVTDITEDDYFSAKRVPRKAGRLKPDRHRSGSASRSHKPIKPPKPTEAELSRFTKSNEIELSTKSARDFILRIDGDRGVLKKLPVSPSYIIKNVLGTFIDIFYPDKISLSLKEEHDRFVFKVRADDGSSELERRFYFYKDDRGIEVEHKSFFLPEESQNKGLSKKIMKESLDLYESLNVSKVHVEASGFNGMYTWAKYGFVPRDVEVCNMLADELDETMAHSFPNFSSNSATSSILKKHISNLRKDPKAIRLIADYDKPIFDRLGNPLLDDRGNQKKAGKELLLKSGGWSGVADLNDPDTLDRWKNYCNTGIKRSKAERRMTEQNQIQELVRQPLTEAQLSLRQEFDNAWDELYTYWMTQNANLASMKRGWSETDPEFRSLIDKCVDVAKKCRDCGCFTPSDIRDSHVEYVKSYRDFSDYVSFARHNNVDGAIRDSEWIRLSSRHTFFMKKSIAIDPGRWHGKQVRYRWVSL